MLAELFTDAAAALLGHALGILQGITNRLRRIKPLLLPTLQHASPVKGPSCCLVTSQHAITKTTGSARDTVHKPKPSILGKLMGI